MVKRIGQKLRGAAGASIMMALGILMAVAALSASMLSIAVSAPQAAIAQQTEEQSYLAAVSAARLLQDILNTPGSSLAMAYNDATDTANPFYSGDMYLKDNSGQFEDSTFQTHIELRKTPTNTVIANISTSGYNLPGVELSVTTTTPSTS